MKNQKTNEEIVWCGHCKQQISKAFYIVEGVGKYKTCYHISCFLESNSEDLTESDIESLERLKLLEEDYNEDNVDN